MHWKVQIQHLLLVTVFLAAVSAGAGADEWRNWRGPEHNGTSPETNLPSKINAEKDVRWTVDLPGTSSSSPIVSGGRVFLVSNGPEDRKLYGICVDVASGKVLWQKQLSETDHVTSRNTMASSSPVTDGKTVYFTFGSGDLVAVDFDGNEVWSKNLMDEYGQIGQQFGYSSTPLLYEGKLYFPILRGQWETGGAWGTFTDKDSQVVCLDAATGEEVWRVHRGSDANGESFDSYASASPFVDGDVNAIIVQGGDHLSAQDAATGAELWRQEHNPRKGSNWRLIPSPVVAGDLVVGIQPRGGSVFAVRGVGEGFIAYQDSHWIYEGRTADVPNPAYYQERLFVLNGTRKILLCIDPQSGEELWRGELDASARIWASPIFGDGKVFCLDERGQLTIASVDGKFKVLSQTDFGGGVTKSSVAISDGSLYLRTGSQLIRVGG